MSHETPSEHLKVIFVKALWNIWRQHLNIRQKKYTEEPKKTEGANPTFSYVQQMEIQAHVVQTNEASQKMQLQKMPLQGSHSLLYDIAPCDHRVPGTVELTVLTWAVNILRTHGSADSYRCAPKEQPHAEQSLAVRTRHTQKQLFHKTNVARLQYFFLLTQMQVSIVLFYFSCHAGYYARKPVCCLCCCAAVKPAPMKEPMKLFSVEKTCASSASTSGEFWELCWVNGHSNCQERYSSPIVLTDAAVKNIRYRYFESFIWHYCQMSRLLLT